MKAMYVLRSSPVSRHLYVYGAHSMYINIHVYTHTYTYLSNLCEERDRICMFVSSIVAA